MDNIMWPNHLIRQGILGINKRNASYLLPLNDRQYYPLVDDKLLTKELALKNGMNVPRLYTVIRYHHQINDVFEIANRYRQFVIKPSMGSGGEGIMVLAKQKQDTYTRASGQILSREEIRYYLSGILAGLYSLGGQEDKVLVEYKVQSVSAFEKITYQGVPDIRVIVFKGVPIMAMLRLPTKESNGKANLHHGAIGVGIDLFEGITLQGVHHDRFITHHPDRETSISGIHIPYWDDILKISARAYEMTHLGYMGVDVVIDRSKGPMVLEFNARPGLSIQLANQSGLLKRLESIDTSSVAFLTLDQRIAFGKTISRQPYA
jgi:alpha-L-glutamate ligase-like protein